MIVIELGIFERELSSILLGSWVWVIRDCAELWIPPSCLALFLLTSFLDTGLGLRNLLCCWSAMAAASAVLCNAGRGVPFAALKCKIFVRDVAAAGKGLPFAFWSGSGFPGKVLSRRNDLARCALETEKTIRGVEGGDDWIAENDELVRSLPLFGGAGGLFAVLLNRSLSGIAPVADSSRYVESVSIPPFT